jgi:hypothetical protein
MSSPFLAALAKLDDSLQSIQSQIECLRAGLEVNETQLGNTLADARQHSTILRDLIRGERPDAKWGDRNTLEVLIQECERAAQDRRNQQRRARLLHLADELEAGSIRHRFQARRAELDSLRLQAVGELRAEAALPEQEKELPGPGASQWLSWVCSLQDDKDAMVLTRLRKDFGGLERFAGEMEESYWEPGQAEQRSPSSGRGPESTPLPNSYRVDAAVPGLDKLPAESAMRWNVTTAAVAK